jgi:hypothetical protein
MASYYIYSGAAGSGNGSSWANAYTNFFNAFISGKAAGDVFYVAHDHAESAASSLTMSLGSIVNPIKIICVNRAGSVPPVSADRRATAQVTATGSFSINFSGNLHADGIIFTAGGDISFGTSNTANRLENCSLRLSGTTTTIIVGGSSVVAFAEWRNTTVSFGGTSCKIRIVGHLVWRDTPSALLGTIPTTVIVFGSAAAGRIACAGVDFSAAGAGKTIISTVGAGLASVASFLDCKLNASVTKADTPTSPGGSEIDFVRCGASGNYTVFSNRYNGTLIEETTIIRTGGASDGTTPISWKIVTTVNCNYSMPFECPLIATWNDTVGSSVTATVEGIWGGGAVPNDDDIWVDVQFLGDASSPQASFVNDGKANLLATAAGQTTSLETWGSVLTTFNGTQTNVTMSNGNLTATHNNTTNDSGAMSANYIASGKCYFEITVTQRTGSASNNIGIILSGGTFINASSGFNTVSIFNSGGVYNHNSNVFNFPTILATGDVVGFAIDLNARLAWIRVNGGNWNNSGSADPATGTGGMTFIAGSFAPFVRFATVLNDAYTGNFGQSAFAFTKPVGFASGWQASSGFKLSTSFTPQMKGWVYGRVKCAKASSTFYIDPKLTLS